MHEFLHETNGIVVVFSGEITDEEVHGAQANLHGDPLFNTAKYVVIDMLDVIKMRMTARGVWHLARADFQAAKRNPDMRMAIVVKKAVIFGLGRMYQLAGGPWNTELFSDMARAKDWLAEQGFDSGPLARAERA